MNYGKPPIDIAQQITLLKSRGLSFDDESKAAHYLSNISSYRLRAYTYPFQNNTSPGHPFTRIISFEQIIELYVFDRHLRLLIFDAIEKIEIALRTKIIYNFALTHGSHWHEDITLYRDHNRFIRDINKLYEEIDRSTETFIKHYKSTYTSPKNPPAWMSLEVASMGLLSKLFENLKVCDEKKAVSAAMGLGHPKVLESWMPTGITIASCFDQGQICKLIIHVNNLGYIVCSGTFFSWLTPKPCTGKITTIGA